MPEQSPTILAIDPGTKEIGVAVLSGSVLRYYAVKTFKRRQPPHALLADISHYIASLINEYRPETLAIEKAFLIQEGAVLLSVAAEEIKYAGTQQGLPVYEYAPHEVRQFICQTEKATKRQTAQRLAEQFPELALYLRQPTKWEETYWANVFDAVAVGMKHLYEISKQQPGNTSIYEL